MAWVGTVFQEIFRKKKDVLDEHKTGRREVRSCLDGSWIPSFLKLSCISWPVLCPMINPLTVNFPFPIKKSKIDFFWLQ